jgi:hypothetical protein
MTNDRAFKRRAVLKKTDSPDVSLEVCENADGTFSYRANRTDGWDGVIYPKYSPEQLQRGDTPPMTIDRAWATAVSNYPDYEVTAEEDGFPMSEAS